ncbi:hypothetical protein F5X98DRAFT_12470 [Xylaria grammica]|nr:hypothetical protein F5X98DRAFT_12470 [Xylaria grammica]
MLACTQRFRLSVSPSLYHSERNHGVESAFSPAGALQPSNRDSFAHIKQFLPTLSRADGVPQAYLPSKQQRYDEPSWYSLDLQALYSTCLVSRRLRHVAQAILYHEFVPGYGDSGLSRRYSWYRRLASFLRTVSLRRDLANLVRRLCLSHSLLEPITIESHHVETALEESARTRGINLSDFLEPFHYLPDRELLGPYRPAADELVAMLLSCLSNLARLYLTMATLQGPIPVAAFSAAGVPRLSLQSIEFYASGSNLRQRLGGILEMSLSTLRTLDITSYCSYDGDKLGLSDLLFPSLRNISVTNSGMSGADLELLLSCCTGLETFIYDATSIIYCIKPSNVIKFLKRHQETLTTMRLDLRDARLTDERFLSEPMPSLKIFPTLLNVSLNSLFIYNRMNQGLEDDYVLCQLLPPSIVSLQLYDTVGTPTFARLLNSLLRLVDAVSQGQFPCLRMVRCYIRRDFDDYSLVLKFASAGVCLDMISGPPSDVVPRRRGSTSSSSSMESVTGPRV